MAVAVDCVFEVVEAPEIHEKKLCPKRKSELMAFAVVFDDWLATGKARDYANIASITGLSRFRISKIMNYRQLSVKEQSDLLLGYK